jgi:hypothetical protein
VFFSVVPDTDKIRECVGLAVARKLLCFIEWVVVDCLKICFCVEIRRLVRDFDRSLCSRSVIFIPVLGKIGLFEWAMRIHKTFLVFVIVCCSFS